MGFSTLIDILGSTIIGGMLLLLLMTTMSSTTKNQYFFSGEVRTQSSMINITEIMDYDFKRIGYCANLQIANQRKTVANITEATYKSIRLVTDLPISSSDINGDGMLNTIRYYTQPVPKGTYPNDSLIYLYRQVDADTPQLMDVGLVYIGFRYFRSNGKEIIPPIANDSLTNIRKIEVNLKFEDPYPYDYQSAGTNVRTDVVATAYWRQLKINF